MCKYIKNKNKKHMKTTKWCIIYTYHADQNISELSFKEKISNLYEHYVDMCQCDENLFDLEKKEDCDAEIFDKYNFPHVKCKKCDFDTSNFVYGHDKFRKLEYSCDTKKCFFNFELNLKNGNRIIYDAFDFNDNSQKNDLTMWFHNNTNEKVINFCN